MFLETYVIMCGGGPFEQYYCRVNDLTMILQEHGIKRINYMQQQIKST